MNGVPFDHTPVLLEQVVELLAAVAPGLFVDATVGGGGHAAAVLDANPGLELLGIDRDEVALAAAADRLARFGARARVEHARFDALADLAGISGRPGSPAVTAVLFDLGVSSHQLDDPSRGFSFRHDGPLDMRMDRSQARTAADVVNGEPVSTLADLLRRYGDERHAARIAAAIVAARPVTTTGQLAAIVAGAVPAPARRRAGGHPARRTFQAIRIAVNEELVALRAALDQAIGLTAPGGRIVALAYHSGENRMVKERFRLAETGGCECPPGLPCACGAVSVGRRLRRAAGRPGPAEVERNPRASSARLRALEITEPTPMAAR